ncbi:MAG: hypothetical protein DMF56_05310 [Acidobacteria bacterium]|nr:MAG: hypothetical protein DMF56_05310 [Acidobacteriota bacterium]
MRRLAFVLVFVLACSHQSDDQKLIKAASPVKSWAASLAFASELWLDNRVPKSLMENSVESAKKAIDATRKEVGKSKASESLRKNISSALDELSDSASTLGAAVRNHDANIAAREAKRCHGIYDKLEALEQ